MKPHEIHFEFMKAAITGALTIDGDLHAATTAKYCSDLADAALLEYQNRWPNLDTEK